MLSHQSINLCLIASSWVVAAGSIWRLSIIELTNSHNEHAITWLIPQHAFSWSVIIIIIPVPQKLVHVESTQYIKSWIQLWSVYKLLHESQSKKLKRFSVLYDWKRFFSLLLENNYCHIVVINSCQGCCCGWSKTDVKTQAWHHNNVAV